MIDKLIDEKAIILNLKAKTKSAALKEIAQHLKTNKFVSSALDFEKALNNREQQFSTGIGDEIAIPHAQDETVLSNVVLIAKSKDGISWNSADGKKVKYIFSIALNSKDAGMQVDTLQALSKALMNPETKVNLQKAKTSNELMNSLVVGQTKAKKVAGGKNVVAVTACPTGIAHTYMSAEKIEQAASELGYNVKVETQGRKIDNKLTDADIKNADVIILAIDKGIDGMERFNGKTVLKVGTKAAIKDSKKLIKDGLAGKGEVISVASKESEMASGDYSWSAFKNVYKNLMGGVSRMLPFVVAGGIILGIAFLIDTGNSGGLLGVTRHTAGWFAGLGKLGLIIFVPVLGAYVSYSIVGAEGLLPGMIAGMIASGMGFLYGSGTQDGWNDVWGRVTPGIDQSVLASGSGFIGAMVGGYVAAASVTIARRYMFFKVNKTFRGVVDIVAMPVVTVILTGTAMFIFQIPLAYFAYGLREGLTSLADKDLLVIVTLIIGVMMAFDMGGPVNKVAYVFGTGLIGSANATESDFIIMGAVMISGMVPPLGIALSTAIFGKKSWSKNDIEAAKANWALGAFFITEGAIPFAAKDPKRVIPSIIVGSAVAGLMVGLLKVGVSAPHGGIIVASLFKSFLFDSEGVRIGMGITFLIASLAVGMTTTALMLGIWRKRAVTKGTLKLVNA